MLQVHQVRLAIQALALAQWVLKETQARLQGRLPLQHAKPFQFFQPARHGAATLLRFKIQMQQASRSGVRTAPPPV